MHYTPYIVLSTLAYTQVPCGKREGLVKSLAPDIPSARVNLCYTLCHPYISPDLFIDVLQLQVQQTVIAIMQQYVSIAGVRCVLLLKVQSCMFA